MTEVAGRSSLYPPADDQGNSVQQVAGRVYETAAPVQSQRRFGARGSRTTEQRVRLFPWRNRRNAI